MPSSWFQRDIVLSSAAGWPGATPSMSELERRRLEEALEAAQGEARGAQLREEQLQAECERLQGELKQLQETRAQVKAGAPTPGPCSGTCGALGAAGRNSYRDQGFPH